MREILFRGKRSDNGEWVEGYAAESGYTFIICDYGLTCGHFTVLKVDDGTIGQYTGLTDKNGVKIFEGDIVKAKDETGIIYRFEVKFGKCGGVQNVLHEVGYLGFFFEEIADVPSGFETRKDPLYWLNEYVCEVAGNIHNNPELLGMEAERT